MLISEKHYEELLDQNQGYCSRCDAFTAEYGVEPDAEGYECPECSQMTVMGTEQAFLVGHIELC